MERKQEMNDSKFVLELKRTGVIGCAIKMDYIIDGAISGSLGAWKACEYELDRKEIPVVISKPVFLGRSICKAFIVDPGKHASRVRVTFCLKMNWVSLIPPLCFFCPVFQVKILSMEHLES